MEQNTMEQLMEFMKAELKANQHEMKTQIGGLASKIDKMDADNCESKARQEIMAEMKVIQRNIDVTKHEIRGHQRETKADK
jgi:hypothetical protein